MPTTVEQELEMHLILTPEDSIPVPARLTYTADDPYAVHMTFHSDGDPVRWAFSRELLAEGVYQHCGTGDVRLWPVQTPHQRLLYIGLTSPTGTALLKASLPVVSGWRCVDLYAALGIDLRVFPLVGLGSVCRRQSTREAVRIVEALHGLGIRLHGFGFKATGLRAVHHLLYSSDSLAWSYAARREEPLSGCRHQRCSSCSRYAVAWRNRMLSSLSPWCQGAVVGG